MGKGDTVGETIRPIIWLTGQPGSGKSTIAKAVADILLHKTIGPGGTLDPWFSSIIDGDELREILMNKNFGRDGRIANINAASNIALFIQSRGGVVPIVALVSPYRAMREAMKSKTEVLEVYLHTTEIRGRERFFVADYEPPKQNFLDIDTGKEGPHECAKKICDVYWAMAATTQRP